MQFIAILIFIILIIVLTWKKFKFHLLNLISFKNLTPQNNFYVFCNLTLFFNRFSPFFSHDATLFRFPVRSIAIISMASVGLVVVLCACFGFKMWKVYSEAKKEALPLELVSHIVPCVTFMVLSLEFGKSHCVVCNVYGIGKSVTLCLV